MTTRKTRRLVAAGALSVIGLAACGGSSNSPKVAALGDGSGGAPTTTVPKGNPTQLLDQWATCERSHGDPNQVDPTIDAQKTIHITFPAGYGGNGPVTVGPGGNSVCNAYLTAASTALRGGQQPAHPNEAKLEDYSKCMRANGISDFPDPSNGGLQLKVSPGSDLDPSNPTFQKASKLCALKTKVTGFASAAPGPGAIQATEGGGPAGGPGGNGGSGSRFGIATSG